MKVKRIEFKGLFGFYDYHIDPHDTITIIHGTNGCGKTTMLKIINSIFNKQATTLKSLNFQNVKISFSTGLTLTINRKFAFLDQSIKTSKGMAYLEYCVENNDKLNTYNSYEKSEEYENTIQRLIRSRRPLSFLEKISDETWINTRTDVIYSFEELLSEYGDELFKRFAENFHDEEFPEDVSNLLSEIDVRLITTDRLNVEETIERSYRERSTQIKKRVEIISNNISQKIKEAIQSYAQLSQAKDRTFPIRAIKQDSNMTVEDIKQKMLALEEKRNEFIETGILEEEKDGINITELVNAITDNNRQNLALYAVDTEEKLDALADISSSINLFRKLIENSFNHKKMIFNKDFGFKFITTYSGSTISPQNLSSGEQHQLVMFYDLIFNTSEKSLILIDEPELSLHIKWQLNYVDELLNIINNSKFSAILATHSPQIIHDHWDLTASLAE